MIGMQISSGKLARQRDRPSLDDQLEKSGLLCGRDAMAGGTVLGLQVGAASKLEGWSSRNLINLASFLQVISCIICILISSCH